MTAHEDISPRDQVPRPTSRNFGLVFAVVFLAIACLPILWGRQGPYWWAIGIGAGFLAVAWVAPAVLDPLNRLWFRLGLLLHAVVSPIVLGIMFFGAVLPTGLIMRMLGKDPLRLRFDRGARTYWIKRDPPGPAPESFRDQF